MSFGAYVDGRQVGFARVVTDEATFAWICDVFVDESSRGRGVGKRLIAAIVDDPRLQGLTRMMLATRDAHGLYAGFGFAALDHPGLWMVRASREPPTGAADDRPAWLRQWTPIRTKRPRAPARGRFFVSGEGWLPGGS